MSCEKEKKFYDTLSDNEEQTEDKFEKMEVVEEDEEEMKSKDQFLYYNKERKTSP